MDFDPLWLIAAFGGGAFGAAIGGQTASESPSTSRVEARASGGMKTPFTKTRCVIFGGSKNGLKTASTATGSAISTSTLLPLLPGGR